eukprot:9483361-Pyramimonas_sp.AAC.2
MALHQPEGRADDGARLGVGADRGVMEGAMCRKVPKKGTTPVRHWGATPAPWNCSRCFAIPKTATPGPKGKGA